MFSFFFQKAIETTIDDDWEIVSYEEDTESVHTVGSTKPEVPNRPHPFILELKPVKPPAPTPSPPKLLKQRPLQRKRYDKSLAKK
jgi:hypothetical protein